MSLRQSVGNQNLLIDDFDRNRLVSKIARKINVVLKSWKSVKLKLKLKK